MVSGLKKANKVFETLRAKKPDAAFFRIEDWNWDESKMDEWIGGQGLFASNYLIYVDRVCKNKEAKSYLVKNRKVLAESENFFLIFEDSIDKATADKIASVAWKTEGFFKKEKENLTKEEKLAKMGEKIDFFEYSDAFGSGDKKRLWVLYRQAVDLGVPAEEIHSIFWWQLKTMIISLQTKTAAEAGLKPFPYQKAKAYAERFGLDKLQKIASEFVRIYHEAHRGKVDLYNGLERLILEM